MPKEKLTKAEIIENIHSMEPTISRGDIHTVIDLLFDELKVRSTSSSGWGKPR